MNTPLQLGDAELDAEHARLDDLIAALLDAPPDAVVPALDALNAHATAHFAAEDIVLRAMGDGNAKCHIDEHAAVLKSLAEVHDILVKDDTSEAVKARLRASLATQLRQWLPEHVQAMDASVASHRTKQRFGGAPIKLVRPGSNQA